MNTVRDVEREILDEQYKKFDLIRRPDELAIGYLFKVYGDFWRELTTDPNPVIGSSTKRDQLLDNALHGLGHCFRWIAKEPIYNIESSSFNSIELDEEAFKFLSWGMSYAALAADHIALSREALKAELNEKEKTITFSYPSNFDPFFFLTQMFSSRKAIENCFDKAPLESIEEGFNKWRQEVRFHSHGIHFPEKWVNYVTGYSTVREWVDQLIWPELSDSRLLNNYSLGDFKKLYCSLFIFCQYWSWLEDLIDAQMGPENPLGSCTICLNDRVLVEQISVISGLSVKIILSIIEDLTFDTNHFHVSLNSQPFVKSKNGKIFSLPRLISSIDPCRMLSGALNKGKGRKIYDGFIKLLEQSNLDVIESQFKNLNLTVLREKRLINDKNQKITPDLIIFDERSNELLIADYKHALNPIGTSEVIYKIEETQKGVEQVRKYIDFVKNNLQLLQTFVDKLSHSTEIYGLLLFRWPMPLPISNPHDIEIVDWFSLKKRLNKQLYSSLFSLIKWIRNRPDLSKSIEGIKPTYFDVPVTDWKYRRVIFARD